jgi:hypothetical protein
VIKVKEYTTCDIVLKLSGIHSIKHMLEQLLINPEQLEEGGSFGIWNSILRYTRAAGKLMYQCDC